ncbi:MAG: hypothetical protein HYS63_00955 [Methylocystis sp.]|nr:hypothetical protein [Methylocystis sp.]
MGTRCASPLLNRFGAAACRASFPPHNTSEEADLFIQSTGKARQMLV